MIFVTPVILLDSFLLAVLPNISNAYIAYTHVMHYTYLNHLFNR